MDGGGYKPSGKEAYIIKAWNKSLEDFNADVVFLGDSINANGTWAEWFPDLTVCNLGVHGDSVEQIMYRGDMAIELHPKKIFILAGVNNISRGHFNETINENYSLLLQKLCETDCEIYVQSILPVRKPSNVDNKRIEVANKTIKELADEYGCTFIDIHNMFIDENNEMKKELTKDGVHLNENGYAVWIEQIEDNVRD